ncbi:MAG: nuclear mRNA export, poly(A)+RNA binding protein [Caeruleum heppii]|nr:MAG: nuclear mRNA export, poly(A)+RNA binding protein [Caeruleum heppii]
MAALQRNSTPTGPASGTASRNVSQSSTHSARGGIQKRSHSGPVRIDKDGDLEMGAAMGAGRGRTRNRAGKNRGKGKVDGSRDVAMNGVPHGTFTGPQFQKAIARGLASTTGLDEGSKKELQLAGLLKEVKGKGRRSDEAMDQISVGGWTGSKAASNPDGGVKDLVSFLERKATGTDEHRGPTVRIKKSRRDGDSLLVSVRSEDAPKILRLDTFSFAGVPLTIRMHEASMGESANVSQPSEAAKETVQQLTEVLARRYDPTLKLLNLSSLGKDPDLAKLGVFEEHSTGSKFFPALMAVCEQRFTDAQQKRDAVVSVLLADNELTTVSKVTTLAPTFPDLKNLDLSNNKLRGMNGLQSWRWKFRHLDHLILTGNPIERSVPDYKADVLRWYPSLRILNNETVRTEEEAATRPVNSNTLDRKITSDLSSKAGEVGDQFVRIFFQEYDRDRHLCLTTLYDSNAVFSFTINDPNAMSQDPTQWSAYLDVQAELRKTPLLPSRTSYGFVGLEKVKKRLATLPPTRHPPFTDPTKWLIECHPFPHMPGFNGTGGKNHRAGGVTVIVHGEFEELHSQTGVAVAKRSFERSFVLKQGGPAGVKIVSDIVHYRTFGGPETWVAEPIGPPMAQPAPPTGADGATPLVTPHAGPAVVQKQKELMVLEMSKRTGMTIPYSTMCLEEKQFDFNAAMLAYEAVKATLPKEAFVTTGP